MNRWHERELARSYDAVLLDRAVVRSRSMGIVARPVHTAVGVTPNRRRDLHGLWMRPVEESSDGWSRYVAGLQVRGLVDVAAVVTEASPSLEEALASIWPVAELYVR
jgi:transposase-like protein